jgi:hypothetical protein
MLVLYFLWCDLQQDCPLQQEPPLQQSPAKAVAATDRNMMVLKKTDASFFMSINLQFVS